MRATVYGSFTICYTMHSANEQQTKEPEEHGFSLITLKLRITDHYSTATAATLGFNPIRLSTDKVLTEKATYPT
uniref:Uncharacterized protein n=1 Tax=Vespula pensylvanica TaxID=30213 RepID=A0A834U9A9_VESPE|nr:hypothetical protein H0235_008662 [Vespula pensylvanica]